MGRRTSGQIVGLEKIGNVQANLATLTTTQTNTDLTLDPNGTGGVIINGDVTIVDQGDLRLREAAGNGTNYIGFQASAAMASNYTLTWPNAVAAQAGYVLSSDASGNLSWTNPSNLSISVTDPGSTATVHYPIFATNSGSLPSSLTPLARTNLAFVPSTGELSSTIGRHPDIIGSTSNSGTLTLRGTSSSTKAAASVLMSDGVSSSSNTTGTLVVTGGVGVSGNIHYGGTIQRNTAGGVNSPSARFGNIGTGTKLDFHVNTSVGGSGTSNTQQYGISFSNGSGQTQAAIVCAENGSDGTAIGFFTTQSYATGPQWRTMIDNNGHLCPSATNTYDLGTSSLRWRNIYTQDLHLSNGIGDYTMVEGEENLYLVNNKNGKSYKFALIEVPTDEVPPKSAI